MGVGVEQVHVTAAAAAEPGLTAEDLGRHLPQVHAVGDGEVVWPMGRGDSVVGAEVGADTRGHRLLAGGQVHLPWDQALADVEPRPLVGVVLPEDGLLIGAAEDHRLVQPHAGLAIEGPGGCGTTWRR